MDIIQGIIYVITNQENGKMYVGQTKTHKIKDGKPYNYGIIQRFAEHVAAAKRDKTTPIALAINEYTHDVFTIDEIERCNIDIVDEREAFYIREFNTLVPNGYNVQQQSKQVIFPNCVKIVLKGIKKDGVLEHVRAYVSYADNSTDRLSFYGSSFDDALQRARQHIAHIDKNIVFEHSSLKNNDNLWWPYKEKIDRFNDQQITSIKVCLFGTQNSIRVEIKTSEMKSWKETVRMVFGGKKMELNKSFTIAMAVVNQLEHIHGIQHVLDPRLDPINVGNR